MGPWDGTGSALGKPRCHWGRGREAGPAGHQALPDHHHQGPAPDVPGAVSDLGLSLTLQASASPGYAGFPTSAAGAAGGGPSWGMGQNGAEGPTWGRDTGQYGAPESSGLRPGQGDTAGW